YLRRFPAKELAFGHDEVDARRRNIADGADRAAQLTFERAECVDVLHKARGAKRIRLVENFIADAAAAWQAVAGEPHAHAQDIGLGDEDDAAVAGEFIGNAASFQ